MKSEVVQDKVVSEIPIYLSKCLSNQLHIFQYPVRPSAKNYDDESVIKAQIKPVSGQVELEVGLRTRTPTFDRSKGEQIALNVDGAFRDKRDAEDNYYASNTMDKLVLTSSRILADPKRYAVGIMGDGSLHLSPVASVLAMKPSFTYLDLAEKRSKADNKDTLEDSDPEDSTKKVTVRFERPETERSRELKEKSYGFLQRKIREEAWIPLDYHRYGSEQCEFESRYLYCSYPNEEVDQFSLDTKTYLTQLVPPQTEAEVSNPGLPANLLSMNALKALPLPERLRTLIQNAGVASFMELVCSVAIGKREEDTSTILKTIQQMAVLVQGNWVVKSDVAYPKDSCSESGLPNEVLQRARDCTLFLFTKDSVVHRTSVTALIDVPDQDLTRVLRGIAKCRGSGRGSWEFLLPTDNGFLKKYHDVVQRQQMTWQLRYEQLSQYFKK